MRNGDFGEVATRIYDPATGDVTGANRVAFANNQIPQDRISPIARRLLALIPEPNIAGAPLGQNNYQKAQTREKTTDGFDAKVNYSMNEKDQLSYRLSFMRPVVFDPALFGAERRIRQWWIRGHRYELELQFGSHVDAGLQCQRRCSTCGAG